MAIIDFGKSRCSICGETLRVEQSIVSTTHFLREPNEPLWRFSDSAMHRLCFNGWELRHAFAAQYRAITGDLVWPNRYTNERPGPLQDAILTYWMFTPLRHFQVTTFQNTSFIDSSDLFLAVTLPTAHELFIQEFDAVHVVAPPHHIRTCVVGRTHGAGLTLLDTPEFLPIHRSIRYFKIEPRSYPNWSDVHNEKMLGVYTGPVVADIKIALWARTMDVL